MVICPMMHIPLATGLSLATAEELRLRDFVNKETPACPWCGKTHLWWSRDAFLEGRHRGAEVLG
jgi:hypothetical protein